MRIFSHHIKDLIEIIYTFSKHILKCQTLFKVYTFIDRKWLTLNCDCTIYGITRFCDFKMCLNLISLLW